MAFMALFGWIFIPIILLALVLQAVTAPLFWALEHPGVINAIAAGLLAVNLLFVIPLLRAWKHRQRNRKMDSWLLLVAIFWEGWVVFLCALYLIVQPLRFIPEDFGVPFNVEHVCYDEWELVSCQGVVRGYNRTQEEIDQYLGTRITYAEDKFISNGQTYTLRYPIYYDERTIWREAGIYIPGSVVTSSFEGLGLDDKKLRRVIVNFNKEPEERPIGWLFYMQDRNTLLVYYDCIFFRAERVSAE